MSEGTSREGAHDERTLLRLGGVCAVLGTAANFVATVGHGDLPETGTRAALGFVAERDTWSLVHLTSIFAVLLWLVAFAALSGSMPRGAPRLLARFGLASISVGAAVHVVFFSIDGYALKASADAWAAASGSERESLFRAGDLVLLLQYSQFVSAIFLVLGLPFVLFGLSVALSRAYPGWLGWAGAAAGAGTLFTGVTRFLGLELVPDPVLFGAFGLGVSLWMAFMGALMWKRAGNLLRADAGGAPGSHHKANASSP